MTNRSAQGMPEIWGGMECSINRVKDLYKDQLVYSGHYNRTGDLEAIAALGITVIRHPILWERHQPKSEQEIDWSWTDQQLAKVQSLGLTPVVGLLHHGSGPSFTNLLDSDFAELFAQYALKVANRYPWIANYTPVNEPLTTARFSGLYGLWFPHHENESSFYKMLLNQLKGTVLAMQAIRSINPAARLIQTEDLGKTYGTPLLDYQASFENDRRLLTFDLLTGKVKAGHPQYQYMLNRGIAPHELEFFQENICSPDILGLNHYITSERWLDEAVNHYPPHTHGGNGIHNYADTEAVRANPASRKGFKFLAREVWERYHLPMAATEVHLHCTREEQMRWFKEIFDDCCNLKAEGIDIRGVTAWAVLGSFDWDSLLTKTGTQYESGVFDVKTYPGRLKRTALAELIKRLAAHRDDVHPVLDQKGWWHPDQRQRKMSGHHLVIICRESRGNEMDHLKIDIARTCIARCLPFVVVADAAEVDVDSAKPWAVIQLGESDLHISRRCAARAIQYATICAETSESSFLNIWVDHLPMTHHQINKVLDLLIDGDTGRWIFDSHEITFKMTRTMGNLRSA